MSSANLTSCKVTPRRAAGFIRDVMEAELVPILIGSPGMAKSSIIRQVSEAMDLHVIDHRLSTTEPTDMSGLPHFDAQGYAYHAPFRQVFPIFGQELPTVRCLNERGEVVNRQRRGWNLFFDEMPSATKQTQAACFKVILDRMVGQYHLHPMTFMTAAGNLMTDRSIVNPISTGMQSRLIWFELEIDPDQWMQDVAFTHQFDYRIIAYISAYKDKLMHFRPNHVENTFACPRTWEFTNRLLTGYTKRGVEVTDEYLPVFAGTLGLGVGAEFLQYAQSFKELSTADEVTRDPIGCSVPSKAELRYAMASMLSVHVNHSNFPAFATYMSRFDNAFKTLFGQMAMLKDATLRTLPEFAPYAVLIAKAMTP